jgi:hypothetical protein
MLTKKCRVNIPSQSDVICQTQQFLASWNAHMENNRCPSFAQLRKHYQVLPASPAAIVSLSDARRAGDDPLHILSYTARLGVKIETLEQLLTGINSLENEEELSAFQCREGVAVSVASDDEWILFTD